MPQKSDEEAIEVALTRFRSGESRRGAAMELMAYGYSSEKALEIVSTAYAKYKAECEVQKNDEGNLKMLAGVVLLLVGIGVTIYSLINSSGMIVLPIGILALGGYLFFCGMSRI